MTQPTDNNNNNNICEDEQQTWRMESQKHKAFADSVSRVLNA